MKNSKNGRWVVSVAQGTYFPEYFVEFLPKGKNYMGQRWDLYSSHDSEEQAAIACSKYELKVQVQREKRFG